MSNIVDMRERIAAKEQKEQLEKYRGRVETIQKMIQCSSCSFRCAMCGQQAKGCETAKSRPSDTLGLPLCEDCGEDFREFLSITRGKKAPTLFWHNKEWQGVWSALLDYRKAISAFVASREFNLLMEELNSDS